MAYDVPGETATGERLTLDAAKKKLNEETRFPEKLDLRIGAQVMLVMVSSWVLPSKTMLTPHRI